MGEHWFVPHKYGYGAFPANWKGWAFVAGFIAVELVLALFILVLPSMRSGTGSVGQLAVFLAALSVIGIGFVLIARRKTKGQWRGRWGEEK